MTVCMTVCTVCRMAGKYLHCRRGRRSCGVCNYLPPPPAGGMCSPNRGLVPLGWGQLRTQLRAPPQSQALLSLSSRWWCPGPDDDSLIETNILTCMHVVIHSGTLPRVIVRSFKSHMGNQSLRLTAPFCYSIRYRLERKKRSSRTPPFPPHASMLETPPAGQKCTCQL